MFFAPDSTTSGNSIYQPRPAEHSSALLTTFPENVAASGSPPALIRSKVSSSRVKYTVGGSETIVRWSSYLESEFQRLVALRAERKATPSDMARLTRFRKCRQQFKNPISADQILRDFRARELRTKALDAVQAYVLFVKNT